MEITEERGAKGWIEPVRFLTLSSAANGYLYLEHSLRDTPASAFVVVAQQHSLAANLNQLFDFCNSQQSFTVHLLHCCDPAERSHHFYTLPRQRMI